jgi:hypothetical protein
VPHTVQIAIQPAPGGDIHVVRWFVPRQHVIATHHLDFTPEEARAVAADIEAGAEPRVESLRDAERRRVATLLRDTADAVERMNSPVITPQTTLAELERLGSRHQIQKMVVRRIRGTNLFGVTLTGPDGRTQYGRGADAAAALSNAFTRLTAKEHDAQAQG